MRFLISILLLLFLPNVSRPQKLDDRFNLDSEISSLRYCQIEDESIVLRLKFKTILTNRRGPTIVVFPPLYPALRISRTEEDLRRKKYEFDITPPLAQPLLAGQVTTNQVLQKSLVRPGEAFETETLEIPISTKLNVQKSEKYGLAPGSHYAQLVMDNQIDNTNNFLRVVSQPIEFLLEDYPQRIEQCK